MMMIKYYNFEKRTKGPFLQRSYNENPGTRTSEQEFTIKAQTTINLTVTVSIKIKTLIIKLLDQAAHQTKDWQEETFASTPQTGAQLARKEDDDENIDQDEDDEDEDDDDEEPLFQDQDD